MLVAFLVCLSAIADWVESVFPHMKDDIWVFVLVSSITIFRIKGVK